MKDYVPGVLSVRDEDCNTQEYREMIKETSYNSTYQEVIIDQWSQNRGRENRTERMMIARFRGGNEEKAEQ